VNVTQGIQAMELHVVSTIINSVDNSFYLEQNLNFIATLIFLLIIIIIMIMDNYNNNDNDNENYNNKYNNKYNVIM